ncbi:hypothetical protein RMSM_01977 [Rhodopirellula maiorica SM1]|uniref:Uncharacterized protein n=1 Tax=Rhodopirellula maiorica SM1 TaxID=1265738 RepID=M5RPF5_9BACT|nr:hypothetical protein RMSM_01977 [Rhodopirellula maiorica SM1]
MRQRVEKKTHPVESRLYKRKTFPYQDLGLQAKRKSVEKMQRCILTSSPAQSS